MHSKGLWLPQSPLEQHDVLVAFRGSFDLSDDLSLELRHIGASSYLLWLDGELLAEGPLRFANSHPEYSSRKLVIKAGSHCISVVVVPASSETRTMPVIPPFFQCSLYRAGDSLPIRWRCCPFKGRNSFDRRTGSCLGWAEWYDSNADQKGWREVQFDDSGWPEPESVAFSPFEIEPAQIAELRLRKLPLKCIAEGFLRDDQEAEPLKRFCQRDLSPNSERHGFWRRYDLGQVRLGWPYLKFDLPVNAVVEFGLCDRLIDGRVQKSIPVNLGENCNLYHFAARGGEQGFLPVVPKGGRYLEVHVLANHVQVRILREEFIERSYYLEPAGQFKTSDALLNQIWRVGVNTFRACVMDAVIGDPALERGQRLVDTGTVGIEVASVAYDDLRPFKRGLLQSAYCAREDGLVAGKNLGQTILNPIYAAQWTCACVRYWELTGDDSLLKEAWSTALRNLSAYESHRMDDGSDDSLSGGFVDWGYIRNEGPSDIGLDLHHLLALRAMDRWGEALKEFSEQHRYRDQATVVAVRIRQWLKNRSMEEIGYHRVALAIYANLIEPSHLVEALDFVQRHWLRCFPNDLTAPRHSGQGVEEPRLVTPCFAHYALDALLRHDRDEFVFSQYRKCWGWALAQGLTTWPEVFDLGYSHCHLGSSCPTWQLSRYVLGLHPRYDLGQGTFQFCLRPGTLQEASGMVPAPGIWPGISVRWFRRQYGLYYVVESPVEITLRGIPAGEQTGMHFEFHVPLGD